MTSLKEHARVVNHSQNSRRIGENSKGETNRMMTLKRVSLPATNSYALFIRVKRQIYIEDWSLI